MRGVETFIPVGRIIRPHGLCGDVKVISMTDYPERFRKFQSLYVEGGKGCGKWVEVEGGGVHGNYVVLKLKGTDDRQAAEDLRGFLLKVRREDYPDLPKGREYVFNLIGLRVKTVEGRNIGSLIDILQLPGQDIYVVDTGEREIWIPGVKEFIKKIDISKGVIRIQLLEGLCD
ncbi:16S rRNA processing protein RimM [bacterium]|nr:16S rRNA processing protein RimM [bacterium]